MQIQEELLQYKKEFSIVAVYFSLQLLFGHFYENASNEAIEVYSLFILIILFTIYLKIVSFIFLPVASVKFNSNHDPIPFILDETSVKKQNINFSLTIDTYDKFDKLLKLSKILNIDHSKIHFQIHWKDCEMLQVEPNDVYSRFSTIEYPCISLINTNSNQLYKYSFKVSSNPNSPELLKTKIEVKLFFEEADLCRCKTLIYFMRIESESREVIIKRKIRP
ncbi:hypothetical protein ASJ81_18560 [Methanosarcina spelaei]|uniref:Uncharacterized protein n=1 Tax=Methanosarcina spelaei TaxID=1036679 RepID=A0A2A2HUK0_9EURY|nr:hypothetical protein [Methanosarcina spelaei]PAV13159.1 hypothetical protein ASJ81_18560 [Methanosarcina spelaei]